MMASYVFIYYFEYNLHISSYIFTYIKTKEMICADIDFRKVRKSFIGVVGFIP